MYCQDQSTDTVYDAYSKSDFIFIGKLTGYSEYEPGKHSVKKLIADFDVIEIYKGRRWNKVMVVTDLNNLVANKEYLIYGTWGEAIDKKGKKQKAGFFNSIRFISVEKDKALPDVKKLVKILKKKFFGRIKSPRAKIILRKCNCSHDKI